MKPFLKSSVVYIPVDEGVYFEAGQDSFLFKGRGLFPLVSRIASLLDGTRTLAAIEGIVPDKAHALLELLLRELKQRRMLHMVIDTPEPPLPKHVELLYSGTIGFLKDQTPHWSAVFRRWRDTRIIAVGAGLSYRVMVRNLMRSGVRDLVLALDQSEDPSADQAAVTASVAEAKGQDAEIRVDWVDTGRAAEAAAVDDTRILYVSDAIPTGDDNLFRQLTALDRPDTLAGGVFRGVALVGPQSGEGDSLLSIWGRFAAKIAIAPYPRAARAILGSVVAFEALKSLESDESAEPERRDWLRRHCYHVRHDTSIEVHKLFPQAYAPTEAAAPAHAADPPLDPPPDNEPLFDPVTGCLQWEDFAGAGFPLPHRAIRTQSDTSGGFTPDPVTQWALTPQEVNERATARALETLGELENPATAVAGSSVSPVLAARDEAVWRQEARANAAARHPAFLSKASPIQIDPESVDDEDARMLIRLVRLYTGAFPDLWLLGGGVASIACVRVNGRHFQMAAAVPAKAIVEALGDTLSTLQMGRRPDRQRPPFLGPLDAIKPDLAPRAIALGAVADFASPEFQFSEIRLFPGGGASRRWVVGRIEAHE